MVYERPVRRDSSPSSAERRLFVFFEAGASRYAVEAVGVMEVARPDPGGETLHEHLGLRDLSQLLGGLDEQRPGTALVLDTSPTLAVRVKSVEGVFDAAQALTVPLARRMIPLVAPAIRGGLVHEGRLYFVLDTDGVARGLPRQLRRRERITRPPTEPCLVFDAGPERLAVPLSRVSQVVPAGPTFNRSPGQGACVGAIAHDALLAPVFDVSEPRMSDASAPAPPSFPLIVLVEAGGELLGLGATRADGVRQPSSLGEAVVLDVERMFS